MDTSISMVVLCTSPVRYPSLTVNVTRTPVETKNARWTHFPLSGVVEIPVPSDNAVQSSDSGFVERYSDIRASSLSWCRPSKVAD